MMPLESKERKLFEIIGRYKNALVAFSGGLDSAIVLWASVKALGHDNVWAVTSNSASLPEDEEREARLLAGEIGLPAEKHIIITTDEINDPNYRQNPIDRCYFCKKELFDKLKELSSQLGAEVVFDGANLSDLGDYRPGRKAAEEFQVVSPLLEAELTKDDLRGLARKYKLSFSEKPAAACLASRIPHGTEVTKERLRQIDTAESALRKLGFTGFRVRYHNDVARLEFRPEDIIRVLENGVKDKIVAEMKKAGFRYVALDLEGYRQGSLNQNLKSGEKR
ncbi:conserved hypothetical protein [Candidatus Zixiibacteriota bacterium]|nr:conserved hypothetical protein [candidate division Zixibacteria bacterium]